MSVSPDRAAFEYVGAFVDELARAGLKHVCISPGSRSAPLALTIARHAALTTWIHLDERVAAFFALGMARALNAPVALLSTSGTAGANFYPAVIEARLSGVPLIVFTADRPPELRDVGAAQTIDQNQLFGQHAKWFVDMALPEAGTEMLRYARTVACRALATAAATPPGPVHLNFPFREPLVPTAGDRPSGLRVAESLAWHGRENGAPWVVVREAMPVADAKTIARISGLLRNARRPLLICGPQFDPSLATPLAALARDLAAPLLADPLSQLRWGPHDRSAIIDRYDALLRHEPTASALRPDLVLRFGGVPTSKSLLQYLERHADAHQIVVDPARWPDPQLTAADMVHADPRRLCEALITGDAARARQAAGPDWLAPWRVANDITGRALETYGASIAQPFEGRALAEVAKLVPSGGTLFVSSSMPIRDLDAFAAGDDRALTVFANRGANGIDGVISTALGVRAARATAGPLVLVIGDIAFYHDMNGLLAATLHALDATIVVLNNDGGGIFSFLPQAAHPEHFELLFGTPHGLTFEPVARLYGARHSSANDWQAFRSAVKSGIEGRGLHIIEMRTDRAQNVTLHRNAWAAVHHALVDTSARAS